MGLGSGEKTRPGTKNALDNKYELEPLNKLT
jgi:hypothetical protein